jgi:L-asparaginase II
MRLQIAVCTAAFAASAVLLTAAPAAATPPQTGCPSAFDVMTVAELEATGHIPAPRNVDASGNHNGLVCAKPLSDSAARQFCRQIGGCTIDTIYYYRDDDVTL